MQLWEKLLVAGTGGLFDPLGDCSCINALEVENLTPCSSPQPPPSTLTLICRCRRPR